MRFVVKPAKKFELGFCNVCSTNCANQCSSQCGGNNINIDIK